MAFRSCGQDTHGKQSTPASPSYHYEPEHMLSMKQHRYDQTATQVTSYSSHVSLTLHRCTGKVIFVIRVQQQKLQTNLLLTLITRWTNDLRDMMKMVILGDC
jgi:hypothetical protein